MSQYQPHIQPAADLPSRVERLKKYLIDNAEPITYGVMLGAGFMTVFVIGSRANKDLLVLKRNQFKKFKKNPNGVDMPGVEYTVRGVRMWLIPAMLPVEETPYA